MNQIRKHDFGCCCCCYCFSLLLYLLRSFFPVAVAAVVDGCCCLRRCRCRYFLIRTQVPTPVNLIFATVREKNNPNPVILWWCCSFCICCLWCEAEKLLSANKNCTICSTKNLQSISIWFSLLLLLFFNTRHTFLRGNWLNWIILSVLVRLVYRICDGNQMELGRRGNLRTRQAHTHTSVEKSHKAIIQSDKNQMDTYFINPMCVENLNNWRKNETKKKIIANQIKNKASSNDERKELTRTKH